MERSTTCTESEYRLGRMFLTPKSPSFLVHVPMCGSGSNAILFFFNKKENKRNVDGNSTQKNSPSRFIRHCWKRNNEGCWARWTHTSESSKEV